MKKVFPVLLALFACLIACSDDKSTSPSGRKVKIESLETFASIVPEISELVNAEIDAAVRADGGVSTDSIALKIQKLEKVDKAAATESGAAITVEMKDGSHFNVLVGLWDDDRLFTSAGGVFRHGGSAPAPRVFRSRSGPRGGLEHPDGLKALILAPFQWSFQEDLDGFSRLLTDAGFTVTTYVDKEVTLDRCRGDFLAGFDAIVFSTHGSAEGTTLDGRVTTQLLTGEDATAADWSLLNADELNSLGVVTMEDGSVYWAIGVPWLEETLSKPFPKSYFHAGACESAMDSRGESSLSECLITRGVGGFNGYDASIASPLAEQICSRLLRNLGAGQSLKAAGDDVRGDAVLRGISYVARFYREKSINVDLLKEVQRIDEPYYLKPSSFPYDRCTVNFYAKGHYTSDAIGGYDATTSKTVTVDGALSNGTFTGDTVLSYGSAVDSAAVEISLDVNRHQITGFKVSGSTTAPTSADRWSVEAADCSVAGNTLNSHFIARGSAVDETVDTIRRRITTLANGQVVERTDLNYLLSVEDDVLEFTFFSR